MPTLIAAWRKLMALEKRYEANFSNEWGRLSQLASVGGTTVTTTGLKSLGFLPVPASIIQPGSVFRVKAPVTFDSSGAPSGVSFYVYWQGISGELIGELDVPASGLWPGASNAGGSFEAEVYWLSQTETFADMKLWWKTAGGVANSIQYSTFADTSGLTGSQQGSAGGNLSLGFSFSGSGFTLNSPAVRIAQVA